MVMVFFIFADPSVAERVLLLLYVIDVKLYIVYDMGRRSRLKQLLLRKTLILN